MIIHWFATKLSQLSVSSGIFVGVTKSILVLVNWTITTGWTSENRITSWWLNGFFLRRRSCAFEANKRRFIKLAHRLAYFFLNTKYSTIIHRFFQRWQLLDLLLWHARRATLVVSRRCKRKLYLTRFGWSERKSKSKTDAGRLGWVKRCTSGCYNHATDIWYFCEYYFKYSRTFLRTVKKSETWTKIHFIYWIYYYIYLEYYTLNILHIFRSTRICIKIHNPVTTYTFYRKWEVSICAE